MALDKRQFKDLIEKVLGKYPELLSDSAVNLLLGTAAQESRFGTFIRQLNGGPALGIFQMEPNTFEWLRELYAEKYPEIAQRQAEELEWDLRLAILFARLRYRTVPQPLPSADSASQIALYWKKYYNTMSGSGKIEEFIANYRRFVLCAIA